MLFCCFPYFIIFNLFLQLFTGRKWGWGGEVYEGSVHAYPSRNPRLTCPQYPEADAQCRKVFGPWPSHTGHRRLPSRLCGACCRIASRDCAMSVCSPSFPAEGKTLERPPAYPGGRKSGGRSRSNRNSVHGNTDFPLEKQKVICVFKHLIFQKFISELCPFIYIAIYSN